MDSMGLWPTASAHFPRRHNDPFLLLRLHQTESSPAVSPLFPFSLRLSVASSCQALLLTRTRTSNTDTYLLWLASLVLTERSGVSCSALTVVVRTEMFTRPLHQGDLHKQTPQLLKQCHPKFTAAGRIYPSGIPARRATRHPISTFTLAEHRH
ncbi:hypothetical protein V8C34DRAFT_56862 [Trichoderma compactum]